MIASDISVKAINIAKENANVHGVADRIEFVISDLFDKLAGRFDIILSNPPYIASHEFASLQAEVLKEPRIALDGGCDGLDYYRKIISRAGLYLNRGAFLILEMGYGQGPDIADMARRTGFLSHEDTIKDHNGIDRIIILKKKWIS